MRADDILKTMSLREKIAQTFMVDFRRWSGEDMIVLPKEVADAFTRYKFGSFILFAANAKTTEETFALNQAVQRAAMKEGGLPLLITADQEGGTVTRLGSGTMLPGNMALCASGKPDNARIAGEIIGREMLAVGANSTLAPAVDINNNANNPVIGLRSFSDDPQTVSDFANAFLQGVNETGCIACIKHFPGHGDTDVDSHYGLPKVDKSYEELKRFELIPFASAIKNGAEMVMTAHILYPQLDDSDVFSQKTGRLEKRPATMSRLILTEILRGDLAFDGVVCTDAINMAGVAANFDNVQTCVEALNAGADMLCMPVADVDNAADMCRFDHILQGMEEAVKDGSLPLERLNDAVLRILKLKEKHGILDYDETALSLENARKTLACPQHAAEERRLAQEAVTFIRNDRNGFPLSPKAGESVLLLYPYANERTSVFTGFQRAAAAGKIPADASPLCYAFTEADFSDSDGLYGQINQSACVVVLSEISNAQKMNDSHWMSGVVKLVTDCCSRQNKPCVVVSVDKPYDVQLYPKAGAVLAVYGSKASGPNIAAGVEAALGGFIPAGRLPVAIPRFEEEKGCYSGEEIFPKNFAFHI